MNSGWAIDIRNLRKIYGNVIVINELNLSVPYGVVYCLVGPNGAGKTTIIDILLDYRRPTAGNVSVFDSDPKRAQVMICERVGVVPEGASTFDRLSGAEHIKYASDSKGVVESPPKLLKRVGLQGVEQKQARTYSQGMRKRLYLAMALVGKPDLLILDEPFSGLDPDGRRILEDIVREENERGATVLLSSHNLGRVQSLADKIGVIVDGQLRGETSGEELRSIDDLDKKPLREFYNGSI